MQLLLNGDPFEAKATTLTAFLIEAGYAEARVATAVNGDFVPEPLRDTTRLNSGDQIEILAPMQGG